ncbi:MAG TPA: TetR/AcrR family transcriptional regulator [Solirubrobacteraceae bacterium]|nr:TetR/AcrR family transcriptional regulator [Solirubrobacteraceae bacterium]
MPVQRAFRGQSAEDRVAERRQRLLDSAFELVVEGGWSAVTVRGVCAHAGLTARYFYESFSDRDALALAVFDQLAARAAVAVREAVARTPRDATARSRAAIDSFLDVVAEDEVRGRVLLIDTAADPLLRARQRDIVLGFVELIVEEVRDHYGAAAPREEDMRLTAHELVGALGELLTAWLLGELHVSRGRLVAHCADLFAAVADRWERRPR